MVATFLAAIVITSPTQYAGIVALTAILVGIISLVAWLLRVGLLVNLIIRLRGQISAMICHRMEATAIQVLYRVPDVWPL